MMPIAASTMATDGFSAAGIANDHRMAQNANRGREDATQFGVRQASRRVLIRNGDN
jgi:hypothetical protein